MNKMKSLILSCLSMMLCMTISAQTVSFVPNWEKGDKASYYYEKKETVKRDDGTLYDETSFVLNLKVVSKDANGYTLNASFKNPKTNAPSDLLLYNVSFDYKLDATGKLIGFADSAKVIDEIAKLSNTDESAVDGLFGLAPEIYLSQLMEEVAYIHSLNEINMESSKTVEIKKSTVRFIIYPEIDIPTTYKYTLESVKKNIANVKCSTILTNEDIKAYIEDKIKKIEDEIKTLDLASYYGDEIINTLVQERRAEYEEKYKYFDLNITNTYNYSFDNSSKWLNSLSATYTTKGKKDGNDVDNVTEITITKK